MQSARDCATQFIRTVTCGLHRDDWVTGWGQPRRLKQMIRVHILRSKISREQAAALNQESGRIYTGVMVEHWRIYKKGRGHWLSRWAAERYNDYLGGPTSLHAHSRDAAQQGFYKACKVVNAQRKMGLNIRYPWRRKFYRTTIWKNTGISLKSNMLRLALARRHPVQSCTVPHLSRATAS